MFCFLRSHHACRCSSSRPTRLADVTSCARSGLEDAAAKRCSGEARAAVKEKKNLKRRKIGIRTFIGNHYSTANDC